jgi:LysM repeat protein
MNYPLITSLFFALVSNCAVWAGQGGSAGAELSNKTEFVCMNVDSSKDISVSALKVNILRPPTPPPYNRTSWGSDGGGHWSEFTDTIYPLAPDPTELKLLVVLFNNTDEALSNLNLVYALKIDSKIETPVTVSQNRDKIIFPKTSGELEISIKVNDSESWNKLKNLEAISMRFYKGESPLNVSGYIWTRKTTADRASNELPKSTVQSTSTPIAVSTPGEYKVGRGDNLGSIAKKLGIPLEKLKNLNPDVDGTKLRIGQVLKTE